MQRRNTMLTKSIYNPIWDNLLFGAIIIGLIFLTVMVIQKPGKIQLVTIPLMLTGVVIMGQLGMRIMFGNTSAQANLSEIESNIYISGNRVTISALPEGYNYNLKYNALKRSETQYFEFKYDEFYDQGYLITKHGDHIELNEEDTKFLQQKAGEH